MRVVTDYYFKLEHYRIEVKHAIIVNMKSPQPTPPSIDIVCKNLGKVGPILNELNKYIETSYSIKGQFKFYKKKGWTIFYRKSGKSLCYVSLQENKFQIVVIVGITLKDEVLHSNISEETMEIYNKAKQYFDGKWLSFEIATADDNRKIQDVKELIKIKKKPIQ